MTLENLSKFPPPRGLISAPFDFRKSKSAKNSAREGTFGRQDHPSPECTPLSPSDLPSWPSPQRVVIGHIVTRAHHPEGVRNA